MTSVGTFAMACPECGGPLEPAPEPAGASMARHACTTCGRSYLVDLGDAVEP